MKIIVICGGNSSEKEISVKSGMAIFSSIKKSYESELVFLADDYKIIKDKYRDGDVIFNALHGGYGENGEIQDFFEREGFQFIGSGSKACQIAIDKEKSKKIASELNIATPFGKKIEKDLSFFEDFNKPFIIKPNTQGSSVGFFIINQKNEMIKALKYNNKRKNEVIAEEFIKGREITVAILHGEVLPIVEIIPKSGVYNYESKYQKGKSSYKVPAKIDSDTEKKIKKQSLEIFKTIECKHYSRIDYILSEDNIPYFLEINTYPGMTQTSLFPKSANKAELDFDSLIKTLILLK